MSSTSFQESEASALDSKEQECEPLPSVKSTPIAEPSLESTGLESQSLMMSGPFQSATGRLDQTLFAGDTHASLSVSPGGEEARKMTAISGRTCLTLYPPTGPLGLLLKMLLGTSAWGSTRCFLTWEVSATPQHRLIFRLAHSGQATSGTEFGFLPTLTARDYRSDSCSPEFRTQRNGLKSGKTLPWTLGGRLDPTWCEGFMGYPEGWTELSPSEMQSIRLSRKSSAGQS